MRFSTFPLVPFFAFACLGSAGCWAGEPPGGKAAGRPGGQACAAYGPGFVGLAGSDTCVRIGGHVRVEYGSGGGGTRNGSNYGATTQASPPLFGDPGLSGNSAATPFLHLKPAGMARPGPARR